MKNRIEEVKKEILKEASEISFELKQNVEEAIKTLENGDHVKEIKISSKKEPKKQGSNFWKYIALGALGIIGVGATVYLKSSKSHSEELSDIENLKYSNGWIIK